MRRPRPKKLAHGVEGRQPFWPQGVMVMPVLAGTWYSTAAIAASYAKGETLRSLARAYGLKVERIEDALRYELASVTLSDGIERRLQSLAEASK